MCPVNTSFVKMTDPGHGEGSQTLFSPLASPLIFFNVYLFLRGGGKACANREGAEREGDRGSQAALSAESYVGLELTNHEIVTGRLTH